MSAMHPDRRLEYLHALGIDVWVPRWRASSAAPGVAVTSTEGAATASPGTATPPGPRAQERQARATRTAEAPPVVRVLRAAGPAPLTPEAQAQWEALRKEVVTCTRCPLHATRTNPVFGVGNVQAEWLIVGEAPGAEEDRQGEPFVGRAGQLLDSMLRAIGVKRGENAYIANILKSRPPNNRDPRPEEVSACMPYLMRQIALIGPRVMLAVGRIAAQNLLGTDAPIGRLRGRLHYFGEMNTPLVVTYHPAYLLRSPAEKRKAWEDLKLARSVWRQS